MKKRAFALLAAVLLICASGCSRNEEQPAPKYTGGSILDAILGEHFGEPETEPPVTEPVTQAPSKGVRNDVGDYPCFDDLAVIGNSRIETFIQLGLCPNADIYAKVGLTIRSMYNENMRGSDVSVFDEVLADDCSKILIVLGDNESGWPYQNVYIDELGDAVTKLREAHPDAKFYIQGVLPISKTAENEKENIDCGYNKVNIDSLNELIEEFCYDNACRYVGIPEAFFDEDGYLKEGAATDGVHFGKEYCLIWINYLADIMEEN